MPAIPDAEAIALEMASFVQTRGLRGASSSWSSIVSAADTALVLAQNHPESSELFRQGDYVPLLASSRSFYAASAGQSSLDPEIKALLSLRAALAFAVSGNFPSAGAALQPLHLDEPSVLPPDYLKRFSVILGVVHPSLLERVLGDATFPLTPDERQFLESIAMMLASKGNVRLDACLDKWRIVAMAASNDPLKSSMLRGARTVLHQLSALSIWTVLEPFNDLFPIDFLNRLVENGYRLLLPSQASALQDGALLRSPSNSLMCMPTSTGKTLLGLLAMEASLGRLPGLACYIAPYQALANQVYSFFQGIMPQSVQVERAVGGYSPLNEIEPDARPTIIVATPERFDAIVRHQPDLYRSIRCLVVDEAHILEQGERGIRVEGLLSRFQMQKERGAGRIVLLSAVLSEVQAVSRWLNIPEQLIIRSSWRPTTRRLAVWRQSGKLQYFYAEDPLRLEGLRHDTVVAEKNLPWPEPHLMPPYAMDSQHYWASMRAQQPLSLKNIAYLCESLYEEHHEPILCVASTRGGTRAIAKAIAERTEPILLGTTSLRLLGLLQSRWPHLRSLMSTLQKGVAYHNAVLPSLVKDLIEEATKRKELRVVVSTTTLAEGVDLPFRCTVIADWLNWTGEEQPHPMSSLLFRNIAGRCGRAGAYAEGDTVIYENPLGPLRYTNERVRSQLVNQTYIAPTNIALVSPVSKSLDSSNETPGLDVTQRNAALGSQYLAVIQENPNRENLAFEFAQGLLASHSTEPQKLQRLVQDIEEQLVTGSVPLAQRHSPIALSAAGRASARTGLSPDTCQRLLGYTVDAQVGSVEEVLASLLRAVETAPEARSSVLSKTFTSRAQFPIKEGIFEEVIEAWLSGRPLMKIFSELPYVRRSRRTVPVNAWLEGTDDSSSWEDEYDHFSDFVSQVLQAFLPWVCRGAALLSEQHDEVTIAPSFWTDCADFLEYGVNTRWAVTKIEEGSSAGREILSPLGKIIETLPVTLQNSLPGEINDETMTRLKSFFPREVPVALEKAFQLLDQATSGSRTQYR